MKYTDVLSGGEPIIMMIPTSGVVNARVYPPMLIFKKVFCSNPIKDVPDDASNVCYWISQRDSIDGATWEAWPKKSKANRILADGKERVLYVDKCSSQDWNEEAAKSSRDINIRILK